MSDDLVTRLRSVNSETAPYANEIVRSWTHEAADEIERLRKERDEAKERADTLCDAINYALDVIDGDDTDSMIWLNAWFYADPEAMRDLEKWRAAQEDQQ